MPTYVLLGGKVRDSLPVYANINRATDPRTPAGFAALARRRAVDTIMPDVKHCGGLLELTRIAAMVAEEGVMASALTSTRPSFVPDHCLSERYFSEDAEHPFPTLIPVGEHRLPMGYLAWSERHTWLPQERHALNAFDRIGGVCGTPAIPFNPKAFETDHSC